ncbi:MAG: hypothetical protein MZV63_43470 [Marinilabiliales bacterium]|nr:hypothetical protein [Marinilabiliales bacterium]
MALSPVSTEGAIANMQCRSTAGQTLTPVRQERRRDVAGMSWEKSG